MGLQSCGRFLRKISATRGQDNSAFFKLHPCKRKKAAAHWFLIKGAAEKEFVLGVSAMKRGNAPDALSPLETVQSVKNAGSSRSESAFKQSPKDATSHRPTAFAAEKGNPPAEWHGYGFPWGMTVREPRNNGVCTGKWFVGHSVVGGLTLAVFGFFLLLTKMPMKGAGDDSVSYHVKNWGVGDGLPHNIIRQVVQDTDGHLWLASSAGLIRFDGVRFTTFAKATTPGLESDDVRAVLCTRAGEVWVGLQRYGVARWVGGRFLKVEPNGDRDTPLSWSSTLAEDASGGVWWQSREHEACRWLGGKIERFAGDEHAPMRGEKTVQSDSEGAVWFSGIHGCQIYREGKFHAFPQMGGEGLRLTPSRKGGMWAFKDQQIWRFYADGRQELHCDLGQAPRPAEARTATPALSEGAGEALTREPYEVRALLEDRAGVLWIATRNAGLLRLESGALHRVPIPNNEILCLSEDREGILWVGTRSGLSRLMRGTARLVQPYQGTGRNIVNSVCEDEEGRLWITSTKGPPLRALGVDNQHFAALEGWEAPAAASLFPDPKGGLWITTQKAQFVFWRDGNSTVLKAPGLEIKAVYADRRGRVWLASENKGLFRWNENRAEPCLVQGAPIFAGPLTEDATGQLWVGAENGLVFREGADGGLAPEPLPESNADERIRFLVPDTDGAIWIGARGALHRWKQAKAKRFPSAGGLPSNDLRALEIDASGNFWFASGGGLFRTTRASLEEVMEGQSASISAELYGAQEGVPHAEFLGAERHTSTRTRGGRLWFATSEGALEIRPEQVARVRELSPLRVESLRANGEDYPLGPGLVIPPRSGPVKITYTLPNGSSPERLRFRHRLDEGPWVEVGNERAATYESLAPGRHRFEVQAAMGLGAWLPRSAGLDFVMAAAWWETLPARVAGLLLGAVLLGGTVRWVVLRRVRARMARLERETAVERERARIARDMHDGLGASLTQLAISSDLAVLELGEDTPAGRRFVQLGRKARSVSGELDRIVWTVNPRNDTLDRLVGYTAEFASEYLTEVGISLRVALPSQLPAVAVCAETRRQILLAVKEALNNAVKHSAADQIDLAFDFSAGVLRITIAEEGRGFDPRRVPVSSNGLANLQERLAALGGSARVESEPGSGTRVTLEAPLSPPGLYAEHAT
jgi:ligand-binding sensor domain-containing protein/signal transduction histidine kinase